MELQVNRGDLSSTRRVEAEPPELSEGEVLLEVERFGLTTNNITYAAFGDGLGYWNYFPAAAGWGCVPVWGFATITRSLHAELETGERVFGYLPMATSLVLRPDAVSELCFSDASEHRQPLHPWYNRYYRCGADPLFRPENMDTQPVLWALFMTGWMLARELVGAVDGVVISSASSKTALSLAWSLRHLDEDIRVIGLTSEANRAFVEGSGGYAEVACYGEPLDGDGAAQLAFVDIAGNAAVASAVHVALGDRLKDSVTLGATHRAPVGEALPMPGPTPRFFFIPDVAEARAGETDQATYHGEFAAAWAAFLPWANGWLAVESGQGPDAIEAGYQAVLAGGMPARSALIFSW